MNLITGATGFIGKSLLNYLIESGIHTVAAVRVKPNNWSIKCPLFEVGEIGPETNWSDVLIGIDSVIHTAARVHVMNDMSINPLLDFRRVNVEGTLNLARQAAKAGVKKFIFLSSIKVNGESTQKGKPFTDSDKPCPEDPYGISKYEAEEGLRLIARNTAMKVTIIRPVLVYGPGVKGNFLSLIQLQKMGFPLPLGAIRNSRSFISLDNLINFIELCLIHPAAGNQTFLVGDGEDISLTELLQLTASVMNIKSRLIPVPMGLIGLGARFLGREDLAKRLCSNLQIDITRTKELLGWTPPLSVKDGLKRACFNKAE
ncbi:SDR family oxidoreductase [Polynucleobacter sp. AP-Feld-500C-C5]|nr:SDR family oxidoreductase [Polynucleobacter sp. AP-Feld-500C-C5]